MQKKFIALAVAAAIAAPMAAAADVKIYGKMHASWDFVDSNDNLGDDSDDATGVLRAARIGFKGSEDLGGGLSAIWQVEQGVNNGGAVGLRNTYAGLKGGWGQVRLGRHDTPYKIATGKLDIFSDTIADYNNIIGAVANGRVAFDERVPQTVAYITPTFNGFHAAIARVSLKANEPVTAVDSDDNEAWSMMGMYENGPLFASLAYEKHDGNLVAGAMGSGLAAAANSEIDAWKLGLGYKFGASKVGFVYESIDADASNSLLTRDAFLINFAHAFGANTLKVAYGSADDSDAPGSTGGENWALGLDHAFSKRTSIYAIYSTTDNDNGSFYGINSGSEVAQGGGNYTSAQAGNDVDAFSLGIIHKF